MATWVSGEKLNLQAQLDAKRRFVHRTSSPLHQNDKHWLKNTKFAIRKDGRLALNVHHCESY